jgi:signal transduction histidine kinase
MAVTPVIEPGQSELCANQCRDFGTSELQQPLTFEGIGAPSTMVRQTESLPSAVLTRVAQFIAHDFRHHLCAVYANAEFLSTGTIEPADREGLLEEIRVAIDCMTDQLESLLLFTRTGCVLKPRHQSLKLIIEQAIQMVRSHPETRHIKITQQDIPILEGCVDGLKLSSALFNLLLNACQAAKVAPETKSVDIALHHDSSDVFIRVLDRGPGVSHAIRETLFQPFAKAEGTKGMGLGLTIAKCIAQEHGGEVYLEESRPGRTVFVLRLPRFCFPPLDTQS